MAIMKYQKHYNDLDGLIDSIFTGVKIPPVDIKESKTGYAISRKMKSTSMSRTTSSHSKERRKRKRMRARRMERSIL